MEKATVLCQILPEATEATAYRRRKRNNPRDFRQQDHTGVNGVGVHPSCLVRRPRPPEVTQPMLSAIKKKDKEKTNRRTAARQGRETSEGLSFLRVSGVNAGLRAPRIFWVEQTTGKS